MKLAAKNICFRYQEKGAFILTNLSFTAEPGSYWCVAGPNGSGKSTFLKLASGLLGAAHMQGELSWDGRAVAQWPRIELARNIGFVAGSLKTYFPISISEFVLQGRFPHSRGLWSQPTAYDRTASNICLERVGIAQLADKLVSEVSSGELQLAMIARALAQEPRVLILDETTANLDLHHQLRVFELLGELNKTGMTILIVSHDLNLAAEFCPSALWLKAGSTYAQGTMDSTLTDALMTELYDMDGRVKVGRSPCTNRPKIFWNSLP